MVHLNEITVPHSRQALDVEGKTAECKKGSVIRNKSIMVNVACTSRQPTKNHLTT